MEPTERERKWLRKRAKSLSQSSWVGIEAALTEVLVKTKEACARQAMLVSNTPTAYAIADAIRNLEVTGEER